MRKCQKCGKWGLFLRVNEAGLCKECAAEEAAKRKKELSAALEFVNRISSLLAEIKDNGGSFGYSSWLGTRDVPRSCVRRLCDVCDQICLELPCWVNYPLFEDALIETSVPCPAIKGFYTHPYIDVGYLGKNRDNNVNFSEKISALIKEVENFNYCLSRYGEYEYKTVRIVGVTFKNEDGRDRQEILKKIRYRGAPYRTDPDIRLKRYLFEGKEDAIAVYANKEQIGSISRFDLMDILPIWGRYVDVYKYSLHGTGAYNNKFGMDLELRFYKEK